MKTDEIKKIGANEEFDRIKKILNPDLKDFTTKSIGKIIGEWHDLCHELGLQVIYQDISDEYDREDGIERTRPTKAISESPLWAWQDLIMKRCRHQWSPLKEKININDIEFNPNKMPKKRCVFCKKIE